MRTRWIDESLISINGDRARIVSTGSTEMNVTIKKEKPKFDSKLEQAYDQYLAALKHGGEILQYWYHPLTIKLPGGLRYTPDFMVWPAEGRVQLHECKGWSKNLRDGMTRLKLSAGMFTCWDWRLVKQKKGQWEVTSV